ncbi:MAG: hypothetical protein HY335_02320 [Deinococcus sp.]|nr:hypothetical protein [Deinococcus sp.]
MLVRAVRRVVIAVGAVALLLSTSAQTPDLQGFLVLLRADPGGVASGEVTANVLDGGPGEQHVAVAVRDIAGQNLAGQDVQWQVENTGSGAVYVVAVLTSGSVTNTQLPLEAGALVSFTVQSGPDGRAGVVLDTAQAGSARISAVTRFGSLDRQVHWSGPTAQAAPPVVLAPSLPPEVRGVLEELLASQRRVEAQVGDLQAALSVLPQAAQPAPAEPQLVSARQVSGVLDQLTIEELRSALASGTATLTSNGGWWNEQPTFYYAFDQPSPRTGHLYQFITGLDPDGTPHWLAGQDPIVDSLPGDATYSTFREVHYIQVPAGYRPNSLRSVEALEAALQTPGFQQMDPGIVINGPMVTDDAAPIIPPVQLVRSWYNDQPVVYLDFGEHPATNGIIPIAPVYVLVRGFNADGSPMPVDGQGNILPTVPGEPGYTDLWAVTFVVVPPDYVPDSLRSEAAVKASGYELRPAGMLVNCPVISTGRGSATAGEPVLVAATATPQQPTPAATLGSSAEPVPAFGLAAVQEAGYWISRYNVGTLAMMSGLGVPLEMPMTAARQMAQLVGLPLDQLPPPMALLQGVFAAGDPTPQNADNPLWDPRSFDQTLVPAAQAQTLIKELEWAKQFHIDEHFGPADRMAGLVLVEEAKATGRLLRERLYNTRTRAFDTLDASGQLMDSPTALDQIHALWAFADLVQVLNDPRLPRYTSAREAMEFLRAADTAFQALSRSVPPRTAFEYALAIEALGWYASVQTSAASVRQTLAQIDRSAQALLNAEVDTIEDAAGKVYGLLEAYRLSSNRAYQEGAIAGLQFLETLWNDQAGAYQTTGGGDVIYNPQEAGAVVAALNAARFFLVDSNHPELQELAVERLITFYESVVLKSGLQLATGGPAGFPHPALPTAQEVGRAPVLASEVAWHNGHWQVTNDRFTTDMAMFLSNQSIWLHRDQIDGFIPVSAILVKLR